jgi:pullulanase/glycogen debranching enzyme
MLLAGDEFGRTQGGNNNAYCQDSEIRWLNWHIEEKATLCFGLHKSSQPCAIGIRFFGAIGS